MGLQIKHILTIATIFACVAFVYIIAFAPIDTRRSPRAAARNVIPSTQSLVGALRNQLASNQELSATRSADQLIIFYPNNPNAMLNAAFAYRAAGSREKELIVWADLYKWSMNQDTTSPSLIPSQLANILYLQGWALLGLDQPDEAQACFAQVLELVKPTSPSPSPILSYNLACYSALAGDTETALGHWKDSIESGYTPSTPPWWTVDPDLENLHGREEFWTIGQQASP